VPAIERAIRTIKERIRAIVNQLPSKAYPRRLIVVWLNIFPHRDGIHEVMSPCTIITGLHTNTVHSNSVHTHKYMRSTTTL